MINYKEIPHRAWMTQDNTEEEKEQMSNYNWLDEDGKPMVEWLDKVEKEFEEAQGHVTVEFSTNGVDLEQKMKLLAERSDKLRFGYWMSFYCPTCIKHSQGRSSIHVEILRVN